MRRLEMAGPSLQRAMLTYDQSNGECLVFVYREGLLSPVGHDLKIRVSRWGMSVDLDHRFLTAEFDANSLKVVSAIRHGLDTTGLSLGDIQEIQTTIVKNILEAERYPSVRFAGTFEPTAEDFWSLGGTVELHGRERKIHSTVRERNQRRETELQLDQRDFGIRPYAAFFGALRVKPQVTVRLTLSGETHQVDE